MAHLHGVIDADKHFVIDAATREITNQSDKITLMQNDHNSERFTFEIPREIDGHDMSLCNVVRVHYLNIDTTTKAQNPGFYEVDDLQISPDDNKKIIGSWLISANATKNVGNLNFTIRFKCIADDGSIEYAWSSAIFKGISVGQSYNNSGTVAEEYADIFAQWQARIEALEQGNNSSGSGLTEEQLAEFEANTAARHTHDNAEFLDMLTGEAYSAIADSIAKAHEHDNKPILDLLNEEAYDAIAATIAKGHEHANKPVLDKFSEDSKGNPLYNGNSINSSGSTVAGTMAKTSITYVNDWSEGVVRPSSLSVGSIDFLLHEVPADFIPLDISVTFDESDYTIGGLVLNGLVGPEDCVKVYPNPAFSEEWGMYVIAQIVSTKNENNTPLYKDVEGELGRLSSFTIDYLVTCSGENSEGSTDISNGGNIIPDYWKDELDEGAEAINTALAAAGANKSAFLFYTDTHWNNNSQMSPNLLKYLYEHTGMTKTFFGGDIVDNECTDNDKTSYIWDWRCKIKGLPNHHSVVGENDYGNTTTEKNIYSYLFAAEETPDIVRPDKGLVYYIDNPSEHTRYLFLDTAYRGSVFKQVEFITNALKTTPDNWHIVAIAHIWYATNYDTTPPTVGEIDAENASLYLSLFDNYNNRVEDFANCKGTVEFCVGGHTHWDFDSASSSGIPIILCETDSNHVRSGLGFTEGTITEASVNGIIADYENHKIYVVRIGRGESRTVKMPEKYTNVLPLAMDALFLPYNEIGYKENTRWSTTANIETEKEGYYLSGYIPISNGDIIRLKNVGMNKNDEATKCMVVFFANMSGASGNYTANNLITYNSAVWDENGMLIQFTIVGDEMAYIRLQSGYMGEDSIVTINEPIE